MYLFLQSPNLLARQSIISPISQGRPCLPLKGSVIISSFIYFVNAWASPVATKRQGSGNLVNAFVVYARHGHELMGCKSPVAEPLVGKSTINY